MSATSAPHFVGTVQYLPGVAADLYLPTGVSRAPVVVLIPGGGWRSADRSGLTPLAEALANDGMAVVNATYRVGEDGARFPTPVQDAACAVDFAVARARQAGITPQSVVLVGHSSGGQVAAVAALAGDQFPAACPYAHVPPDGFVGLAGAYDLMAINGAAFELFGATSAQKPELWRMGDPATWVGARVTPPVLSVLLAHGEADDVLPTTFTTFFGDRLRAAGHPVQVVLVPKADHQTIYRPEVIEATIRDWVRGLGVVQPSAG